VADGNRRPHRASAAAWPCIAARAMSSSAPIASMHQRAPHLRPTGDGSAPWPGRPSKLARRPREDADHIDHNMEITHPACTAPGTRVSLNGVDLPDLPSAEEAAQLRRRPLPRPDNRAAHVARTTSRPKNPDPPKTVTDFSRFDPWGVFFSIPAVSDRLISL